MDVSVPSYIAMITGTTGLMSLVPLIAGYREQGILRRFSATPIRPLVFLAAEVTVLFLMTAAGMALLVVAAKVAYGLRFSGNALSVAAAFVLVCLSLYSLGFLPAGRLRTYRTASAVTMVVFYPMLFLSGAGMPREILPAWMQRVGREVAILAAFAVACTVASTRLFRLD